MNQIESAAENLLLSNSRQTAEITFNGLDTDLVITESDILLGGLTIDRASVSGSKIEIGSAIASELSLTLKNTPDEIHPNGKFSGIRFEGAELYVKIKVKDYFTPDAPTYEIPIGYFTVDEPSRPLSSIRLSALDRMVQFDKAVDWSLLQFPMTVNALLSQIANICEVPFYGDVLDRPNGEYEILNQPESKDITYRQLLQWVAELTATCAFIDYNGELQLKWYEPTDVSVTPSERYSSDMLENDITITGIEVVDNEDNVICVGSNAYTLRIEGNELIQGDYEGVAQEVYESIGGFTYRPYEASVKPMPYLFPMDMLNYTDKDGITHNGIVTNVTFTMNGSTSIKGQGETKTTNGYASLNAPTKREKAVIREIKKILNETLNSRDQSVIHFNEMIANSMGVYTTVRTMPDGSKKYYMHDQPTLEGSNTIYTQTANGYAYTNGGWRDGNPIWEGGHDKNGNLIVKNINAYGIDVSHPETNYRTTITPGIFTTYYGAVEVIELDKDTVKMPKIISNQADLGGTRAIPHIQNGKILGTNIVYIGEEATQNE